MNARKGWRWWAANGLLLLCSALFITPFLWLLLTALKPIEQTMKFQWLPKSYRAPFGDQVIEVIKERPIGEDSVIVVIEQGARKGERLLLPVTVWDGQTVEIEEQTADVVRKVRRGAKLEMEVPEGWWRIREKFLRKYADTQPRWTCVSEEQIEEGLRFWWENFLLAVEYLSDTDEVPLSFAKSPEPDAADGSGTGTLLALDPPETHSIDLSRFDTLRFRTHSEAGTRLSLLLVPKSGERVTLTENVTIKPGRHDVDLDVEALLRSQGLAGSCRIERLLFRGPEGKTGDIALSEARLILHRATFWTYLGNTLTVCLLGCLGTVLSSSLVAYGFSRIQWPGRDRVFWIVLATMMIPFPVTMIPLFGVFRELGWIGTLKPLWVPAFFGSAFNIFLLRQFFLTIPQELSDAARIDGCSEFDIYWRVVLPLSKPALAVVALFHFLYAWNDFMGPLIYLTHRDTFTLSLALQFYQSQHGGSEWHLLMAMSVLILLPIILLFFFTQKTFIQGIATSGMKG